MTDNTAKTGVSRRNLIAAVVGVAPLLALSTTVACAKTAQAAAGYSPSSNSDKKCSTCNYFQADGSCKIVDGKVSANGVCNLYAKKA
jgi:hypothetical protein